MVKTQEKKAPKAKPAKLKGDLIASDGGTRGGSKRDRDESDDKGSGVSDAFLHFLQSPLVADLLAVAATAALAALAEHRFSSKSGGGETGGKKASGKAVKAAGVAAAAAIGRRLSEEFEEIKKASKPREESEQREQTAQEA